jgi:hypothetical protein
VREYTAGGRNCLLCLSAPAMVRFQRRTFTASKGIMRQMAAPTLDELLAAIRRLPLDERLRLIERAAHEAAEDTPRPPPTGDSRAASLLGLMADEPDLVDQMCSIVYQVRRSARMRTVDE